MGMHFLDFVGFFFIGISLEIVLIKLLLNKND